MVRSNVVRVIVERSLIPLNCLLLFFLLFETRIILPNWLQVFGRMHPLALHFPIVLVLLYAVMVLFFPKRIRKEEWYVTAVDSLLLAAALTASLTALMGFALSGGEDYDPESLSLHKWTGVIIPFLLYIIYLLRKSILRNVHVTRVVALALTVFISVAGHHGAVITHGENFILAPLTPASQRILPAFEDAYVYADLVEPILESKCFSCHNANKSKGDLVMDTRELFMKGGEEGIPWDTTRNDLGILMQRVHMPLEDKKHMPPKGKPQLTEEEIFVLQEWIRRGANFESKFVDLLPNDTLYVIGKSKLPSGSEENYDFAAADESVVTELNNNYRVIAPIAAESPALAATFYNKSSFKIDAVSELAPISNNVVELNLTGMPVKDEDLAALKQFKNLRKLILNFTDVTGKTLEQLKSVPELKVLSLSGTSVEFADLRKLQDFPKLRSVYLWSTPAAETKLADLEEKNKNIAWYAGYSGGDTVVLQLTPPIIQNEEQLVHEPVPLQLKHYVNGVIIRYTLDGSEPDSLNAPIYNSGITIDSNLTVKAKAFKPGWESSNVSQYHFYKRTFVPDSIQLLSKPNPEYKANFAQTLIDNVRSDLDQRSGKWLGFQNTNMEVLLRFPEPVIAKSITFSTYQDLGAWIFPPQKVEIWGGADAKNLKLLTAYSPLLPKDYEARKLVPFTCRFTPATIKFLKVVAQPAVLPAWHSNKGKKGHFFVDEIFVN